MAQKGPIYRKSFHLGGIWGVHFATPRGAPLPPGRGAPPGGAKKCTFFWVFNNSPSRDKSEDFFFHFFGPKWPKMARLCYHTSNSKSKVLGGFPLWRPRTHLWLDALPRIRSLRSLWLQG